MPRRTGRPGLIRTMARMTVTAGTITAVSVSAARRRQTRADNDAAPPGQHQPGPEYFEEETPPASGRPAPPEPAAEGDLVTILRQLSEMKSAGLLDDVEFSAAKAKVLEI